MARKPTAKRNLNQVGGSPAGPGHNSGNAGDLDDEHQQALHLNQHVPSYEEALAAKKKADAELKNVCKVIKSEGGNLAEIKLTIALRTPEGEKALKATLAYQMRAARWAGLPVGTQVDMFGPDVRPLDERAKQEGKIAGLRGDECRPSYDAASDGYTPWIEGWHEGQAVLAAKIKPMSDSTLLRPEGNEPDGADAFDSAAEGGEPPPTTPSPDAEPGAPWADDQQIADRETEPA